VAQLAVVEARVAFQTIHCGPVFDRDFDQFGLDLRRAAGNKGREAPAGVVQRPRDNAWLDADGVFAESVIAFAGHQRAVANDLNGLGVLYFVHGLRLLVVNLFLM